MMAAESRVLYVVACAAPPVQNIHELVEQAQHDGWAVCVIPTPTAATWLDVGALAALTAHPVRSEFRGPHAADPLPPATAVAVVPATFNTINKWAAGISDTFALGILNEALGLRLPIVVAPYAKRSLTAHPAFTGNIQSLYDWGVVILPTEGIRPITEGAPFRWHEVLDAIDAAIVPTPPGNRLTTRLSNRAALRVPRPRRSSDSHRSTSR